MTLGLTRIPGPFPLASTDVAFDAADVRRLEALFHPDQPWQRHQDHFYRCFIAVVELPQPLLSTLSSQVSEALGLDLLPHVQVTAQRMEATDGSGRHTDRPLAGYEAARLVVQLDAAEGGRFRAFDGERIWVDRPPQPNQAVAFELSNASEHDVSEAHSVRRTVVFHFWHPANPPDARQRLDRLFGDLSIGDLPLALDPIMTEAEAQQPEDRTYEAALVAALLHKWGEPVDAVISGYREALDGRCDSRAAWLVHLHVNDFDRSRLPAGWRPFSGPDALL